MIIPPAAAEPIFHIGDFFITNSMVNGWIAVGFFVIVSFFIRRAAKGRVPHGLHNAAEAIVEFFLSEMEKVTGDRKRARQFLPLVGTIFLFLLFSNWIGLLPGTGSIGIYELIHGQIELIPILRPAASDLNLTLAIALFAVLMTHIFGFMTLGVVNHASKFVNLRGIIQAFKKGPIAVAVAFVEFAVGLIEIVGEVAKMLSLSLRLFGNIFAGEVLITVMLGLAAFVVPIPFMLLDLLVGIIQATVFAMLTLAYLTVATTGHGEGTEGEEGAHAPAHA